METDVYERLARQLDELPAGFPRTEDGVEIRILRRLFTPEQAEVALHLTLIPEEPRVIARRVGRPLVDTLRILEEMDEKGLIYSIDSKGEPRRYQIQQFVVGFWEGQVNYLTRELVEEVETYLPDYFDHNVWKQAPQMRTIPVGKSIPVTLNVMPYEQVDRIVEAQDTFAVSNCICRQEQELLGKGCHHPLESCLSFGTAAEHAVRVGRARPIDREEALAILKRAEKEGLVLQPANARNPLWICTCCGCCCGILRALKLHPRPASIISSAFIASHDAETCNGCGTCETRCQMEAIHVEGDHTVLDSDRCIGCGLCVTTCPTDSLSLLRKPKSEQPYVPQDIVEATIRLGRARGKMSTGQLIGMLTRSKADRLLTHA